MALSKECYIDKSFRVACNDTHYDPPKLFVDRTESNLEITKILLSGELSISTRIGFDCCSEGGVWKDKFDPWITVPKFPISNTRNKFTAVDCDTYAVIQGS